MAAKRQPLRVPLVPRSKSGIATPLLSRLTTKLYLRSERERDSQRYGSDLLHQLLHRPWPFDHVRINQREIKLGFRFALYDHLDSPLFTCPQQTRSKLEHALRRLWLRLLCIEDAWYA